MDETTKNNLRRFSEPRNVLLALGILAFTAVIIVSILREKIVAADQNQVTITGQGKVSYQPDMATITLGVQVDRAPTADAALSQLNEKITNIVSAVQSLGIKKEDVKTQTYTLNPQYDYRDNISTVGGYVANQKMEIKVSDILNNPDLVSKVIAAAGSASANQVIGVDFRVSNMNDLKQQARVLAIEDAKSKSKGLADAAGVKLGKVENWYENVIQSPDAQMANLGYGGSDSMAAAKAPAPQVPSGSQEIIVEVGLTYDVR